MDVTQHICPERGNLAIKNEFLVFLGLWNYKTHCIACPEDICINPYADDVLIHGASTLNSNKSEVITISQGLSYDTTLTPIN